MIGVWSASRPSPAAGSRWVPLKDSRTNSRCTAYGLTPLTWRFIRLHDVTTPFFSQPPGAPCLASGTARRSRTPSSRWSASAGMMRSCIASGAHRAETAFASRPRQNGSGLPVVDTRPIVIPGETTFPRGFRPAAGDLCLARGLSRWASQTTTVSTELRPTSTSGARTGTRRRITTAHPNATPRDPTRGSDEHPAAGPGGMRSPSAATRPVASWTRPFDTRTTGFVWCDPRRTSEIPREPEATDGRTWS